MTLVNCRVYAEFIYAIAVSALCPRFFMEILRVLCGKWRQNMNVCVITSVERQIESVKKDSAGFTNLFECIIDNTRSTILMTIQTFE